MNPWQALVESRIREWQARVQRGEDPPAPPADPTDSLESQLFDQVVELRRRARREGDEPERVRLLIQAEEVRIRLSIVLEQNGLTLLAQSLESRIAAEVAARPDDDP